MKRSLVLFCLCLLALSGCAGTHPNRNPLGEPFPQVTGTSLGTMEYALPGAFTGKPVLLLVGYVQDTQFDIDRWLIGLDMTETAVEVYEIPAIAGFWPGLFRSRIDSGMRAGIPKELWANVITVYDGGQSIVEFTGNQNPGNARVILLDRDGRVAYFHDRGFSVQALNGLRDRLDEAITESGPAD